ncbi:MAG: carbon storage regulator CsrA [Gammaproteobacteria bacterium]|nr:carbon storage regulator CsrA [Gammaproteobacteria bacterium]
MLVFTRNVGQTFYIGDDILITVMGANPNKVRIAVAAPAAVSVHREEVYLRIKKKKSTSRGNETS